MARWPNLLFRMITFPSNLLFFFHFISFPFVFFHFFHLLFFFVFLRGFECAIKLIVFRKGALSEAPRYTQPQPLSFNHRAYNLRKLIELPYHQTLSGVTRRYDDTLFNFEFIHAKCAAGLLESLVADYDEALTANGGTDKVLAGKLVAFAAFIRQNVNLPFFLI